MVHLEQSISSLPPPYTKQDSQILIKKSCIIIGSFFFSRLSNEEGGKNDLERFAKTLQLPERGKVYMKGMFDDDSLSTEVTQLVKEKVAEVGSGNNEAVGKTVNEEVKA